MKAKPDQPIDKEPNYETIEQPGLSLRLGPFLWYVEPSESLAAGVLVDGTLLIVWSDGDDYIHIYRHKERRRK